MIPQNRALTNSGRGSGPRTLAAALAVGLCALASCGDDEALVDPSERLCGGETGVGVLVEGRANALELCVDDSDVSVVLTALNRYDVAAQFANADGVFQVRMVFAVRSFPANLRLVSSIGEATNDPNAAWLYYQEIPDGGDPIESTVVTGGTFRLTFVDEDVAAGVFSDVVFEMNDIATGDPAGTRQFAEGIFSISTDVPAATALLAAP
jgi:hypothetical protein